MYYTPSAYAGLTSVCTLDLLTIESVIIIIINKYYTYLHHMMDYY